jgi:hypothetical protein
MMQKLVSRLDTKLAEQLEQFRSVVSTAERLGASSIHAEHLLVELLRHRGATQRLFQTAGLTPLAARGFFETFARMANSEGGPISANSLDARLASALEALMGEPIVNETHLVRAALASLGGTTVSELPRTLERSVEDLFAELERSGHQRPPASPFDERERINLSLFSPGANKLLQYARRDAAAFGLPALIPDALLLGALRTRGQLCVALRAQSFDTRSLSETLSIALQARRVSRTTKIELERSAMHPTIAEVLETAVSQSRGPVGEVDLLLAMLEHEEFERALTLYSVDVARARNFLASVGTRAESPESQQVGAVTVAEVEEQLKLRVVGQDDAIARLMPLINRLRYGYTRPGKPAAVFLFLGPTGVGKTLLAKALSSALFGREEDVLRIDMGQFKQDEGVWTLIGAPPGYHGFGQGKLTNGLRDNPERVVLFDEMEKATGAIYDVLLRFLDEGLLDDPAGPVLDGTKCVIVLTSNALSGEKHVTELDPTMLRERLQAAMADGVLRPELLGRVDEAILFRQLDASDYREITRREVESVREWFSIEKGLELNVDNTVIEQLATGAAQRADQGARSVGRTVTNQLISPLIDSVQGAQLHVSTRIDVTLDGQRRLRFSIVKHHG